jgi:hypothetical protein
LVKFGLGVLAWFATINDGAGFGESDHARLVTTMITEVCTPCRGTDLP